MFQCLNVFQYFQGSNSLTTCELQMEQHRQTHGLYRYHSVFYIFFAYEVVVLEFVWFQKSSYTHLSFKFSFVHLILNLFK